MNQKILVICSHPENRKALKIIGNFASHALGKPAEYLDLATIIESATGKNVADQGLESIQDESGGFASATVKSIAEEIKRVSRDWPVDMVLTDLPTDIRETELEMHLALALNVEMAFVRLKSARRIRRIVITTGGGPHAFNGLKYGQRAAESLNAETLALRIVRSSEYSNNGSSGEQYCQKIVDQMTMQAAMAGISIPVKTVVSDSVTDAILEECNPEDLLIMGVTSRWRYDQLSGSLPEEIARRASNSVMVVFAPTVKELPLDEVFWERNIVINPEYIDRWTLLSQMVGRLIEDRQLPEEMRATVTATVFDREFAGATTTGRGLAIPHAALPNFEGTLGVMAIFKDPINFAGAEETHFVMLLVTPERDYQEYLTILGKVARLMLQPELKEGLMNAESAADAVGLLKASELSTEAGS